MMDFKNVTRALEENDVKTLQILLQDSSQKIKNIQLLPSNKQCDLVNHHRDRNAELYIPKNLKDTKQPFALILIMFYK